MNAKEIAMKKLERDKIILRKKEAIFIEEKKEAILKGQIHSNPQFHDANESLSFVKLQITQIDKTLEDLKGIFCEDNPSIVNIGCCVKLSIEDHVENKKEEVEYIILPSYYDEFDKNLVAISYYSPVVQSLLGKKVGGHVVIANCTYKILSIKNYQQWKKRKVFNRILKQGLQKIRNLFLKLVSLIDNKEKNNDKSI